MLSSPRSTLRSETIELFLHDDARTLDRIRATGDVALALDTRNVTAATLAYDDREGRYDLTGANRSGSSSGWRVSAGRRRDAR